MLKFKDKIDLENLLLVSKYNNILSPVFDKWFTFCSNINNYEIVSLSAGELFKPSFRANSYEKTSITVNATNSWTKMQIVFSDVILKDITPNKIKVLLTKKCIENYATFGKTILTFLLYIQY